MDGIAARRAGPADAAAIRDLTRRAYARWVPVIGREPLPMRADYEKAAAEHRFDLLEEGGALVALLETIAHPDHLLIENVAVAPDRQGRGLGRRPMAEAERIARDAGHAELRLYTNKMFEYNWRLYLRLGYRIDREEVSDLGTTVYMSKRLDAAD